MSMLYYVIYCDISLFETDLAACSKYSVDHLEEQFIISEVNSRLLTYI